VCGDLGPTDTGLETEFKGGEDDPADPEIQSDFEYHVSTSGDVDTRDLWARRGEFEVDPSTNAEFSIQRFRNSPQDAEVDTECQFHPESESSGNPHPSDLKDEISTPELEIESHTFGKTFIRGGGPVCTVGNRCFVTPFL